MGDELATLADKIKKTEEKVEKLEEHIDTIRTGDDAAVEALGYGSRVEAKAALPRLEIKEADFRRLLILDKEEKARLQQQSGAGTSMLPVRQELALCTAQGSCCLCAYHCCYHMIIVDPAYVCLMYQITYRFLQAHWHNQLPLSLVHVIPCYAYPIHSCNHIDKA
jgi:hypothetical protein